MWASEQKGIGLGGREAIEYKVPARGSEWRYRFGHRNKNRREEKGAVAQRAGRRRPGTLDNHTTSPRLARLDDLSVAIMLSCNPAGTPDPQPCKMMEPDDSIP